ncbi:MAG: hypothetical protein NTX53_20655 [candidate division WOR-3 bacterium]|nr:hypothetical protein [candidate division WOR-3 bacterium]
MKFGYLTLILILGLAAGATPAAPSQAAIPLNETLTNGDFSKPLAQGWATRADDLLGEHSITVTPENGAVVRKEMCGNATLVQDIKLTTTNLVFSTRARFSSQATKPDYYATASVRLGFLDSEGKQLGETRIYNAAGTPPSKASNTLHLIAVADTGKWQDYSLNLGEELRANLKGVDAAKVKRLRVSLESFCSGKDAC